MNDRIKIALFGAHVNSSNLGCQALSYSLLTILNKISRDINVDFNYVLFEYDPDWLCIHQMCNLIGIDEKKIINMPMSPIFRARSYIKHFSENINMIKLIKSCDLAIDITAGDSFSDIYGQERFSSLTLTKRIVELLGIPLVLGPQTYGPYYKMRNKKTATRVLRNAFRIIARDSKSAEIAKELSGKEVVTTNDLAFILPYNFKHLDSTKVKLGINVSGLLVKEGYESEAGNKVSLKTNYDMYIDRIVSWVLQTDEYDVFLIPHVKEDIEACKKIKDKYYKCKVVEFYNNPIDVKSFISGLDIFIGSRMHATIASFTTGVTTIPVAYSRKFTGLFESIGYDKVVDLQNEDTQESIKKTIDYILSFQDIKKEVLTCYEKAVSNNILSYVSFKECINEILNKRI